jgi:hypothetical protein
VLTGDSALSLEHPVFVFNCRYTSDRDVLALPGGRADSVAAVVSPMFEYVCKEPPGTSQALYVGGAYGAKLATLQSANTPRL